MTRHEVAELLRQRIGLDPDAGGRGFLDAAVRKRMDAMGMSRDTGPAYLELVASSEQELQSLVDEVVVSESWFFRDKIPFVILAECARRWSVRAGEGAAYRVLSMPCACGEEPYSAAIALLGAGLPHGSIHIDAVDVSERNIASARRAVYSSNAFRSGDIAFRDLYFRPAPEGYALDPRVVAMVRFHTANAASGAFLAQAAPYEAILCRNLLIYLDQKARETVFRHIERLLAPDGLLLVGHAENLKLLGVDYRWVSVKGGFAFMRASAPSFKESLGLKTAESSNARDNRSRDQPTGKPGGANRARTEVPRSVSTPQLPNTGTRSAVATSEVGSIDAASRLAGEGRHEEAARHCEQSIRAQGPSAPAYFLLGMIRQAKGDRSGAESCFEKAIYLDPRHEDALLSLALLAQRRGDSNAAANYRRRAERAFQENQRS